MNMELVLLDLAKIGVLLRMSCDNLIRFGAMSLWMSMMFHGPLCAWVRSLQPISMWLVWLHTTGTCKWLGMTPSTWNFGLYIYLWTYPCTGCIQYTEFHFIFWERFNEKMQNSITYVATWLRLIHWLRLTHLLTSLTVFYSIIRPWEDH